MRVVDDISELVGKTPMLRLNKLFSDRPVTVYGKLELCNPMSVKDRPVQNMIRRAMEKGEISAGVELVEASSGNTAIAIAMVGAAMGMPVKIFMSELCSRERFQILNAFGAKVVLTPGAEHTVGARERAIAYCEAKQGNAWFMDQHSNPHNGDAHTASTGPEIWEQTEGKLHTMVIGLGTSGTFEGLSRYLKQQNPNLRIVGFEPEGSPVYGGGQMGKHKLIGIGPGFVAENFKRGRQRLDELIEVSDEVAFEWTKKLCTSEGVLAGVTTGAAMYVADLLAQRPEYEGKSVCTLICDSGERYLSVDGLFPADQVEHMD